MAIDSPFASTSFGARSLARNNTPNRQDLPKAQVWVNIGYLSDVKDEETGEFKFISLPMGIPLDTMEKVKTNSNNTDFAMFQVARNDLLDQMIEAAASLIPGQDIVINADGGLAIQIRRVKEEVAAPAADETNRYARPKMFNVATETPKAA